MMLLTLVLLLILLLLIIIITLKIIVIIIFLDSGRAAVQIPRRGGSGEAALGSDDDCWVTGEDSGLWQRPATRPRGVRGSGSEESGTPAAVAPQHHARTRETTTGKAGSCSLCSRVGGTFSGFSA